MTRLFTSGFLSLILVVLIVLSACSGESTRSQESGQPETDNAVPVTIAVAVEKDVPVQIAAIGNVQAYSTVEIKPQVDGKLAQVYFREGDDIKKGELLFTIDPRPFEAALGQAKANLARDTAQMKAAEADAGRYAELFKKGIVAEQEYDQRRTDLEALKATVRASSADVQNAELNLAYCYIHSPIDGRIGRLMVNSGNIVEGNSTILAVVNQIKPIYVNFSVPEQKLMEIRKFMSAAGKLQVEAAVPDQTDAPAFGKLTFLNNEVDSMTGTILLKAAFPNEDELLWPGKFVNVSLTLTTQNDAVVVPAQAIQMGQEGEYVFVVKPDLTVESRSVLAGNRVEQEVVIDKGLRRGERVVTNGQLRLGAGVKVKIKNNPETETRNSSGLSREGDGNLEALPD